MSEDKAVTTPAKSDGAALTKVSGSKGYDWIETENVTSTDMMPAAAEIYTRFGLDPAQYLTT